MGWLRGEINKILNAAEEVKENRDDPKAHEAAKQKVRDALDEANKRETAEKKEVQRIQRNEQAARRRRGE